MWNEPLKLQVCWLIETLLDVPPCNALQKYTGRSAVTFDSRDGRWFLVVFQKSNTQGSVSRDTLNLAIDAVAASENGKYDRALTLWDQLLKSQPGDPDLLLNQAVTVLKWIDETSGKLNSAGPDELSKLQEELNAAFTKAETTIAEVAKLPGSDGRSALLKATFYEAKSRLVQPPTTLHFAI